MGPSCQHLEIKGVAYIRNVGCVHLGFTSYLVRIHCPKVCCLKPSFWLRASVPTTTLACIRFRNDPCVHPFLRVTQNQHLDLNIQNFSFYYQIFTKEDGPDCQYRQGSGCM